MEYAGRGDPRRSLELLWGRHHPGTRGPKPGLSPASIAAAGIEIADREGLGAVTMRRVAESLGKSPMALYTYVPAKAELIDLMLDTVLGELPRAATEGGQWRPAVEEWARATWEFYGRHPWVLHISGTRPTLGPHESDAYETQLRLFDGLGLSGLEMARLVALCGDFVRGAAKSVADARTAEQVTGESDEQWWRTREPILDELAGDIWAERYPVATRIQAEEQTFDKPYEGEPVASYTVMVALDTFEFGLQRLLDGIALYIDAATARS